MLLSEISFFARKIHIHHWPEDAPQWSDARKAEIDSVNKSKEKRSIVISGKSLKINDYSFESIKNVGISVPLFKKQCAMVFEARCQEFDAHVHVTTNEDDFLDVLVRLIKWREEYFPNSIGP